MSSSSTANRPTPEQLTQTRSEYQKAERELASKLRRAQEKLEELTDAALVAIPKSEYTTLSSDTTARKAEQRVILATKEPIRLAREKVSEITDALAEARDINSDMSFFQRERTVSAIHKLNDNLPKLEKTVAAFTQAVEMYTAAKHHTPYTPAIAPVPYWPLPGIAS